jgi:hypothetical protein
MDKKDVKAEFSGFGPIPSSGTTFSQGVGLGSSFAPVWTTEPKLSPPRTFLPSSNVPFVCNLKSILGVLNVYINTGFLFTDFSTNTSFSVAGLNEPIKYNGADIVWLDITISSGSVSAITIKTNTSNTGGFDITLPAWDSSGKSYVSKDSSNNQTNAKILLAKYDPSGSPAFTQLVNSNLVMMNMCINGYPAIYPIPY